MNIKTLWPTALAIAISASLLAACGGGSSVRSDPTIAPTGGPPPPPPPSSAPAEPCPSPVTADCMVDGPTDQDMTGGRQSDFALAKRGTSRLTLIRESNVFDNSPIVDFRFGGGTTVEDGDLRVVSNANLQSNVVVQSTGHLGVGGTVTGTLTNSGTTTLGGIVTGDVVNDGMLVPDSSIYGDTIPARVQGHFSQTPNGTLVAVIPMTAYGPMTGGFLSVTGRADIDGTLQLAAYTDDFGPYPLPATPLSLQVLHADGGVFGQFARWTSPGLFITGTLRYQPDDVYFDATAISAAQAMAAARAGDALTLGSAGRFDAALGSVGRIAWTPGATLTTAQRQFLASAASIQRIQNYAQAVRTFDSLSGYGHAAVADALLQQAALPAPGLVNHVGGLRSGTKAGAWTASSSMLASGAGAFSDQRAGFDQWLGDRWLIGASVGWSDGNLQFDRAGGYVRDQAPQWDVYFRRNGTGSFFVLGDVGYSQHQLNLDRRIDLGTVMSNARVLRNMDVMQAYVEAGRDFRILGSRLTPFAGLSYATLHAGSFAEGGNTGFELVAQPSFHQRINAVAGLRLAQHWRIDDRRWTQLNFGAGYLQLLNARDDAYAAFSGAPDVTFALAGLPRQRVAGWEQLSLSTGGENWAWLLSYDRQAGAEAASLGMQLRF